MSTEFTDTDIKNKEETTKPIVATNLPTFDVFGMKIKMDDAQNFLIVVLGLATAGMAINTFAPRLNPFNPKPKQQEEPNKKENELNKKQVQQQQLVEDVVEYYEPLEILEFNNQQPDGLADIVDRVYDDPKTMIEPYKPNKKITYKEISEDIFGREKKILKKKIPSLIGFSTEEDNNLDISSDLL